MFVGLDSILSFKDIISVKLAITLTPIRTTATCKLTRNRAINDKTVKACQRKRQVFNVALLAAAIACCQYTTIDTYRTDLRIASQVGQYIQKWL